MPMITEEGRAIQKELAERIAASLSVLVAMGTTQERIAQATGINPGTISNMIKGKHGAPNLVNAERIVRALHVRRDWFYAGLGAIFQGDRNKPDPMWSIYWKDARTTEVGARTPAPKPRRRR